MLPALEAMFEHGIANKFDGVVAVYDPTITWDPSLTEPPILFYDIIAGDDTPRHYVDFAFRKAEVSWRTGRSSRDVQQNAPHLYRGGDVKWGGSVVREGLVVAFSGVQANLDEAIAGMFADLLIGMMRELMTMENGILEAGSSFIS